ncbi:hypothetical protein ACH5RR_025848 [Cinchona calisaya]|uniref:DUF4283 domain-containing protein n=1 Tax=Cinchona calisaya TaxID=153742 RepID=A0ABD2Z2R9_9GENT
MDALRREFLKFEFVGSFKLRLFDNHHILIWFDLEEDYLRCWCPGFYIILGFGMKILKWTLDFSIHSEMPIVHAWITLEGLPFHLFYKPTIFFIRRMIGNPSKSILPQGSRTGKARICVKIVLKKPRRERVYVENGDKGK